MDNFSKVKNPDKDPVVRKEYTIKNIINGNKEKPKDFLHTGNEIAKYCR